MMDSTAILAAFQLDPAARNLVCLVGGGGKTTTMFTLARALKSLGSRVLVTTTTNIIRPAASECDRIIVDETGNIGILQDIPQGTITVIGSRTVDLGNETKLAGVTKDFVEDIYRKELFDCILVEGDGARCKPIKAPADYEPVIPGNATKVVGVIGLEAVGKPITEESVHRLEFFLPVVKRGKGDLLSEEVVVNLIRHPLGLFKNTPGNCAKYLLLNKADTDLRKERAGVILKMLLRGSKDFLAGYVVASMGRGRIHQYGSGEVR